MCVYIYARAKMHVNVIYTYVYTVMRRITKFLSTTNRIYDYNTYHRVTSAYSIQ